MFEKINGKFVEINQNEQIKEFLIGHTYVPIGNKNEDLSGCLVATINEKNDEKILRSFKHSKVCAYCRAMRNSRDKFLQGWL